MYNFIQNIIKNIERVVAQFGRALALGASGRRFESYRPDPLYTLIMEIFTVEEFQENWDDLIERVEKGERFGIVNEDGRSAVIMSTDDPLYKLYTEHDEAS